MWKALFVVVVFACGSSNNPPAADAPLTNQPFGAKCTVNSDTSTECASIVCSQKCTLLNMTDPSCPNGAMGQKCNMKGYCRP